MAISMTGFGQAARSIGGFRIMIDMKSVNHRYCEVAVRLPRELSRFEHMVKQTVQQHVKRGRVDVFVTVERDRQEAHAAVIDWALAEGYKHAAESLSDRLTLPGQLELRDLLTLPGVVSFQDKPDASEEQLGAELEACAREAVLALVHMRQQEGDFLLQDLQSRMATLRELRHEAARLAPHVVEDYAVRLRARLHDMLQQTELDETRLAMEVALLADRASVDEELTRLASHEEQLRGLLQAKEPVGRKLDFLVQEMNREVNTIGSKASHAGLTAIVVEMKAELEKLREQIQNIE
ncbi:YicC/YloC family endoribonuclease [Paenibacillus sp. YYML68]|uniref:YicC/YloC family endoribonuclease n=1 Tax=Paenibacillus sp. YYML68 TaxID=2909250 RepID=UPI0024932493|nr:YicC/YloC family endoribonuclease [Paenibacillus sp. YYML68]